MRAHGMTGAQGTFVSNPNRQTVVIIIIGCMK